MSAKIIIVGMSESLEKEEKEEMITLKLKNYHVPVLPMSGFRLPDRFATFKQGKKSKKKKH